MTTADHVPTRYEIRIGGHLDQRWSAWFNDLTLTLESDGTTKLCGLVADQAALYGLLTKVRDLGMVLVSIEAVGPPGTRQGQGQGQGQ